MRRHTLAVGACAAALLLAPAAGAALWTDATAGTIGATAEWSNKVELADVDGDGLVDIVFANGGNYSSAGEPQLNRVFLNQGAGVPFVEATSAVFGDTGDLARAVKVVDLDGDGVSDIVVATTYQTQSRLFHGLGGGAFAEVTATHAPQGAHSFGDVEAGDVDGDGDIDLVFADWGPGNPLSSGGARPRVWINDGAGSFTDETDSRIPDVKIGFSWDLEVVDVDGDFALDILVSCKSCGGSFLLGNDGAGFFVDRSEDVPDFGNNYEFAPMDVDADGDLDLVTINDGSGLREHLLINDGAGVFSDGTPDLWPSAANPGFDDNVAEFLDVDSDGAPDFVIGSLNGPDRVLINAGDGSLTLQDTGVLDGASSPGTLGLQLADLNGDMKLDLVMSQGEVASPDLVFLGDGIAPDSAPPVIVASEGVVTGGGVRIKAFVHDAKSPAKPFDWQAITVSWELDGGAATEANLTWIGGYLYRADVDPQASAGTVTWQICATDAAGNAACGAAGSVDLGAEPVDPGPEADADAGPEADADTVADTDTDTVADADADTVTDTDTDTDTVTDADADTVADTDTDTDTVTDADADTVADTDTDSDTKTDADTDADVGPDVGPDVAAEPAPPHDDDDGCSAGSTGAGWPLLALVLLLALTRRRRLTERRGSR